jgi:hypothetical protein
MDSNRAALIVPPPASATNVVTGDIRDAKPPVHIPNVWFWVWTFVAVLALSALAFWLWRRWQKKLNAPIVVPVIPPHERARRKLQAALDRINEPRLFCTLVSDAIRVYMEERFTFHAPERTTEEFLYELQATTLLLPPQKAALADFLSKCDLVKFARYEPTQMELQELLDAAFRLVEETQPRPSAPGSTQLEVAEAQGVQ